MKGFLITYLLALISLNCRAQSSFNAGPKVYSTGTLTTIYNYRFNQYDSFRLTFTDSEQVFMSVDSLVSLTIDYPVTEKAITRTANFLDNSKHLVKTERYKNNNLEKVEEWKYDKESHVVKYIKTDKLTGRAYVKTYEYEPDKTTGGEIVTEASYFNDRVEFYTRDYYDKRRVKYKQVRLNDNKKDVVHVETYTFDDKGRVVERAVFFPEFGVTKHFPEKVNDDTSGKCSKIIPINTERMTEKTKEQYVRRILVKFQKLLLNAACKDVEAKFVNGAVREIIFSREAKKVSFSTVQYMGPPRPLQKQNVTTIIIPRTDTVKKLVPDAKGHPAKSARKK